MVFLVKKISDVKACNTDWIKLRNFWRNYIMWITSDFDFKHALNFIKRQRRKSDCNNLDFLPLFPPVWTIPNDDRVSRDIYHRRDMFDLGNTGKFILLKDQKIYIYTYLTQTLKIRCDFVRTAKANALLRIRLRDLGLPKKDMFDLGKTTSFRLTGCDHSRIHSLYMTQSTKYRRRLARRIRDMGLSKKN